VAKQDHKKDAETLFWVVLKLERVYRKLQESCGGLVEGHRGVYFYQLLRECHFVNAKYICSKIGVGSDVVLKEIKRLDPDRLVEPIANATVLKLQKQEIPPEIKKMAQGVMEQFEINIKEGRLKPLK